MSIIDISTKLGEEKSKIKLAEGKEYEVNTSAKNYLKVQEKMSGKVGIAEMFEMIELMLGKEAKEEIEAMELGIKGITAIVTAISAVVCEESYEEMEKRFQDNGK